MAEEGCVNEALVPAEKPQNGLPGLKQWRYDLPSGIMVAMISLPFSMGIAIASDAPPICGIVSAIIAGFVLPFLGGSYVTISGPAAGLATAISAGIFALGHGDKAKGYPVVLVAILVAGVLQMILARLKVARLSAIFPAAAIEGMLVAIGLMIIVKQAPFFLNQSFKAHDFWEILREIPEKAQVMDLRVFGLAAGCLTSLFVLSAIPLRLFKIVPPPVWVFVGGTVVAQSFLHLSGSTLINVPSPLKQGIVLPDFQAFLHDSSLWFPLMITIVTLLLVDGTESLATIAAVDKIDPYRRKSDPDQTLLAMGASNACSSVLGGLTIIPGIVKSTANILGGGRTQWANFYNACCLLLMLFLARDLINLVPKCVLASILVFIGYRLARPKVWIHVAQVGKEQLFVFTATVLITVTTDLLIGILAGVALKMVLVLWYVPASASGDNPPRGILARLADLFRNPISQRDCVDGTYTLSLNRPLVCFNLFHLIREMDSIPPDAKAVQLVLTEGVTLVDHTTVEQLLHYLEQFSPDNGKPPLEILGLDRMDPVSSHQTCLRLIRQPSVA